MRWLFPACLAVLLFSPPPAHAAAKSDKDKDISWLIGAWEKTADEDNSPSDVVEFRSDGSFITFGPNCQRTFSSYFVRDGYIYITIVGSTKGPIALMFVPDRDHKTLTFTSPRSFHNATYEKAPKAECKVAKSSTPHPA